MGRWANFQLAEAEPIAHKFWFGVQSSEIPWGKEKNYIFISDYEEDLAEEYEFDETQKTYWQEIEGKSLPLDTQFTEEQQYVVDFVGTEVYLTSDDDHNLASYWEQLQALIKSQNLPAFVYDKEKDCQEQADDYYEKNFSSACTEFAELGTELRAKQQVYADIHIKILICCILQRYGSYECYYEV